MPSVLFYLSLAYSFCVGSTAVAQFTPPVREFGRHVGVILTDSAAVAHERDAGLGWILSATTDFTRYTPRMCVDLVGLYDHQVRGWTGWDTIATGSRRDTLLSSVRDIARRCATRFTATNAESRELLALMELSLMLPNDTVTIAALERRIREATAPDERGSVLLDAVKMFHGTHPMRSVAAESLLTRFNALEPTQPWWKMMARDALLPYDTDVFDTTAVRRLNKDNVAAFQALSPAARSFAGALVEGGRISELLVDQVARIPLVERCERQAARWTTMPPTTMPNDTAILSHTPSDGKLDPSGRTAASEARRNCLADTLPDRQRFPSLPNGTWFAAGSVTPGAPPALPVPGHVTLLVPISLGNGRITQELAAYRRFAYEYRAAGLDVVLLAETDANHVWASPPLPSAEIAKVLGWYVNGYLQMNAPLLVVNGPLTRGYASLFDREGKTIVWALGPPLATELMLKTALGISKR